MIRILFLFLLPLAKLSASSGLQPSTEQLFQDLDTAARIDRELKDRLPLMINSQLQGGYFTMPSARTYDAGDIAFGYSYAPPYRIWSAGFQFFDRVEATGNYWIYHGILEGNFGHLGFGDDAERAANLKVILLKKEDNIPFLPEFALGLNDFIGSCRFQSFYGVATQDFLDYNLEASIGYGCGRIDGLFGGFAWSPFRHSSYFWKGLTFAAEYDANNYRRHTHEHPSGRSVNCRINAGVQFDFLNYFHATVNSLRGKEWSGSLGFTYNLGETTGIYPKIYDAPVYTSPIDHETLGDNRTNEEFGQELAFAFKKQGLELYALRTIPEANGKDRLWMKIINIRYREEDTVRERIERVLGSLAPSNYIGMNVVIEADGVPVYEYQFRTQELTRFAENRLGENEFRIIAPMKEVAKKPNPYESISMYQRHKPIWLITFKPWVQTYFGSSTGKFKYELGLGLGPEGYLFDEIYYSLYATWTLSSSTQQLSNQDSLNPSRIINVRTDTLRYNQANTLHLDQAFLQKSWNIGSGWFSRLAAGYFEMAYAGIAGETLYYPVQANWAIGFEIATLLKRQYTGIGFQQKIRQLTNNGVEYFPYTGLQYFVDFYYDYKPLSVDFKISAGQFLARDKGIRLEAGRTFSSALRVGLWYTFTNANDVVNNSRYYDKGFSITMPLDIFLTKSSRTRIGYAMSAWLRDCGAAANTGKSLYNTLYYERFNSKSM